MLVCHRLSNGCDEIGVKCVCVSIDIAAGRPRSGLTGRAPAAAFDTILSVISHRCEQQPCQDAAARDDALLLARQTITVFASNGGTASSATQTQCVIVPCVRHTPPTHTD